MARQTLKGVFLSRVLDPDFTKERDGSLNSKSREETNQKPISMQSKLAQKQLENYQEEIIRNLKFPPPIAYGVFEYPQADREMKHPGQLWLELVVLGKGKIDQKLEKYGNCPVLLYPDKATFKPFRKILYLKPGHSVDVKGIDKTIRLFEKFDPEITILHILDEPNDDQKIKHTELRQKYISATNYLKIAVSILRSISIGDIEKHLEWIATVKRFHLLVMQKENKKKLIDVLSSGTTGNRTACSDIPVMVFQG